MAYKAVIEARKAAEAKQESVRQAVRLGLQIKREAEWLEEVLKNVDPRSRGELKSELASLRADKERLERERDEARERNNVGHELYDELVQYCTSIKARAEAAEAEVARLKGLVADFDMKLESFLALLHGEFGVRLSAEDHEDHNVFEFYAARDALRALAQKEPDHGE